MKITSSVLLILFNLLLLIPVDNAFAGDTLRTKRLEFKQTETVSTGAQTNIDAPDDEFNIFLLMFGIAVVCFMLGFFIVGSLTFLALLFIFLMFISLGVISTSVFIGLYKRSVATGFKSFLIVSTSLCGLAFGIFMFGVVDYIFHLKLSKISISLSGGITGMIAGAFLGLTIYIIIHKAFKYLRRRLQLQ